MKIQSNIKLVSDSIKKNLLVLKDKEYLLRQIAFDVVDKMTERIHIKGIASDGAQIGEYSRGYMAVRTGNFASATRFQKGKKKGEVKDPGVFTKGKNKGQPRPRYNRSSDTKIIVSLTRQLENDWSVIDIPGGYGIGFLNAFNLQKARWVEEGQGTGPSNPREIFDLTKAEEDFVLEEINKRVDNALAGRA